jgi:DnaJ like chaperone protein
MTPFHALTYFQPMTDSPTYLVVMLAFGPIVIGLSIFFYYTRHKRSWEKGIFPATLKFNPANALEAYLALGARLVHYDKSKASLKIQFINAYFNRYFRMANYNFSDSLVFSINHPIQTKTVCDWFNQHLEEDEARAQIVYFLTGLVLIRDGLSDREYGFLQQVTSELKLQPEILQRIIAIHMSYKAHQKEGSETNKQKENGRHRTTSDSDDTIYRSILSVPKDADFDTIKKSYRKLVKTLHPDVFVDASATQLKIAQEKFIEVQRAYDFFNHRSTKNKI